MPENLPMDLDALEALRRETCAKLNNAIAERTKWRDECKRLAGERNAILGRLTLIRKLGTLSTEDVRLLQEIKPEEVESGEAVPTPGT